MSAPRAAALARLLALAALALAWLAPAWWPPRTLPPTVLLVDRSLSVPRAEAEARWVAHVTAAAGTPGQAPTTIAFAARALPLDASTPAALRVADERLDPAATDLASALDTALARLPPGAAAQLVLVSDARATRGDTVRALRAAAARGIPVYVDAVAAPPSPAITAVHAPATARAGERLGITVEVTDAQLRPADVEVRLGDGAPVLAPATRASLVTVPAERAGPQPLRVRLVGRDTGATLDERDPAAIVAVAGAPAILYVGRGDAPLLAALRGGGWPVDLVGADDFEGRASLATPAAVVLDDVPVTRADAPAWRALEQAVRERGAGLVVLGGPRSFAAGGYRNTRLESLLPVTAEDARREDDAAVLFAIDKSGSMESATRGVDRLAYAREAARLTLQALQPTDRAAVLAFDVAAGLVVPFDAADRVATRLEAAWTAAPSGGTRIAPALREAAAALAKERAKRRLLVIVTDGFLAEEPIAAEIEALRRARVEVIAIAIGPDARVGDPPRLIAPFGGEVLRVAEAAELPRLVRTSVAARRAPVATGGTVVRERAAPEFFAAPGQAWPAVAAWAITRGRPGARVALESAAGEPLLATQQVGDGRVAVLPAGLGAWTPQWMTWPALPRFAGALAGWAAGMRTEGGLSMSWRERPDGLHVTLDAASPAGGWRTDGAVPALRVVDPLGRESTPAWTAAGPGRFEAVVPLASPGLYRVRATLGEASASRDYVHVATDESRGRGMAPALADWERDGLVKRLPADGLASLRRPDPAPARPSPAWLAVALGAFLAAVLLDCSGVLRRLVAQRGGGSAHASDHG